MNLWDPIRRRLRAIAFSKRLKRLSGWISQRDLPPTASVITPTDAAKRQGLPKVDDYKGLITISDIESGSGQREWHFLWSSARVAEQNENEIVRLFAAGPPTRYTINWLEMSAEHGWRRFVSFGLITTFIASIAAVLTHIDEINMSRIKLFHTPEMTLETSDTLQIDSTHRELKDIVIRGDPFVRSRLTNLSAHLRRMAPPDDDQPIEVLGAEQSVDISGELKAKLVFDKLSPGLYAIEMAGTTTSGWPFNTGRLDAKKGALRADVRRPLQLQWMAVTPWPEPPSEDDKTTQALFDFLIVFGKSTLANRDVQIRLLGEWTHWTAQTLPTGSTAQYLSQNSREHPKDIVFLLRNVPSSAFSKQPIRLQIESVRPLSRREWQTKTLDLSGSGVE